MSRVGTILATLKKLSSCVGDIQKEPLSDFQTLLLVLVPLRTLGISHSH